MDSSLTGKKRNEREVYGKDEFAIRPKPSRDLPQNVVIEAQAPTGAKHVMTDSTLWWLAAGVLVAAELTTGTFYLLMLAGGLAAGALAAHSGLGATAQVVIAALVGGGAVLAWHLLRPHPQAGQDAQANADVNLDIGETVQVSAWQPDGSTQVKYRGAQWQAVPREGSAPSSGAHRIVEVRGSQLILEKISN